MSRWTILASGLISIGGTIALFLGMGQFTHVSEALPGAKAQPATHSAGDHSDWNHAQDVSGAAQARSKPSDPTAGQVLALMLAWDASTDPHRRDQMEAEAKALVTDANVDAIARVLPPKILETPFGFMVLGRWAALDRKTAVEWMAASDRSTNFQVAAVLRGWVESDEQGLQQYINSLPDDLWKEQVLAETSNDALANYDPLEAIALLRQMQPGEKQTMLLESATTLWAQADPTAAAEWVNEITDPVLQARMIQGVAVGYASQDPKAAAEWLLKSLEPGAAQDATLRDVIGIWTRDFNPEDAAAWVTQLPQGNTRQIALEQLVRGWQESDPSAVAAWVKDLPPGSLQE